MNNFEKAITTLEFDKIREMLAACSPNEGSREMAKKLCPSSSPDIVRKMQSETDAAKQMQTVKGMPPLRGISDITDSVQRACKGAPLSIREIINVSQVYMCARQLIEYNNESRYGVTPLTDYFSLLVTDKPFENTVDRSFIGDDEFADTASDTLYDIRKRIKSENNRIRDNLQKYITSSAYSKFLQEQIVTMRDGRYVIPVKLEYKNEIKGLVHDISASGATLFIEPMSVVEANNELCVLAKKEEEEEDRILAELSARIADSESTIIRNYHNIIMLSFIFAKSQLSFSYNGMSPLISEKKTVILKNARHPIISADKVVPISVSLGDGYDTLVITGPNTGGKTVTLKTIGLFCMMAQAGLHIPASDGSKVCVFDGILADIGDEQSIEQSLSTFSSHMVNIVEIYKNAGARSLILLDELGAGTDPVEGAALAVSILEALRERSSMIAATTHYAELKSFAVETEGVINASCEFDVKTLRPTYRLIIGTPGKSNAFAISGRLGLDEGIIARAERYVSGEDRRFEQVIERLEKTRIEMEQKREEADRLAREMKEQKEKSDAEIKRVTEQAQKDIERSRAAAVRMVESAKASSEFIFAELDKVRKQRESSNLSSSLEQARRDIKQHLKDNSDLLDPIMKDDNEGYELPRPLKKGDSVLIVSIKKQGTLLTNPDSSGNVTVQAGAIKTKTDIKNLRLLGDERATFTDETGKRRPASEYKPPVSKNFSPELDLRGQYGDEGCILLDRYLDEAKLSSIDKVRIIHGKGTGALRKAITAFLKSDPRVKSVRMGEWGEGDTGVTVVELK